MHPSIRRSYVGDRAAVCVQHAVLTLRRAAAHNHGTAERQLSPAWLDAQQLAYSAPNGDILVCRLSDNSCGIRINVSDIVVETNGFVGCRGRHEPRRPARLTPGRRRTGQRRR